MLAGEGVGTGGAKAAGCWRVAEFICCFSPWEGSLGGI